MAKRPLEMRDLCAHIGEDDGVDPRSGRNERQGNEHKTTQLCRQVMRAVSGVLASCDDPMLQGVEVVDVAPASGARCLRVTVRAEGARDSATVLARLAGARGRLRMGVAEAISRKRVPELVFEMEVGS